MTTPYVPPSVLEGLENAIGAAEHKPEQWSVSLTRMGAVATTAAQDALPGFMSSESEDIWANFGYKRDGWLAVAAVNALPTLIELVRATQAWRDEQNDGFSTPAEARLLAALEALTTVPMSSAEQASEAASSKRPSFNELVGEWGQKIKAAIDAANPRGAPDGR